MTQGFDELKEITSAMNRSFKQCAASRQVEIDELKSELKAINEYQELIFNELQFVNTNYELVFNKLEDIDDLSKGESSE